MIGTNFRLGVVWPRTTAASLLECEQDDIGTDLRSIGFDIAFTLERRTAFQSAAEIVGRENHGVSSVDLQAFQQGSDLGPSGVESISVHPQLRIVKRDF